MKAILNTYSATELKEFIKKTNIKGYSKLKKDGLVSLMTKAEHKGKFNHIKEKGKAKVKPPPPPKTPPPKKAKVKPVLPKTPPKKPPRTGGTKIKFKSVVSELNKKGKEYREARKDFGKDDPLRPKKKKTVEPKKVKKIVKKTELIPYKKNKIAISITEDKSKGKSYPHKNLVGRGKAPVPPPSGKVLKLPPKPKKFVKPKEKDLKPKGKTTRKPKLDKSYYPTSQRKKVKKSLTNRNTKGKTPKKIKNIQQKKRKMGELHTYNPTLSSIQELAEPEPPYQGKLKADDFADSGYSPQAYKRIYGEIPEVSPTYDTGYKMEISEIQDPLTFDYNIKTPIFHKGTTLFDKKKHDKGVMPNEVYESIYGKDIDTEALIKGNNLTPKLKEDVKAVNKKKEIIARRKAKGKKLLDKAKEKKLDKLIDKKFVEHKKNTFTEDDNYVIDINYDDDSDEEDYRYSNRAPLNVAEYDYFNDILTVGYDPLSESSINRRKDMNMYDNMPIIETILPLSNLPNPIELTERGKIPNSMNGYKPAEKYAVRTTKLDGIPALSPSKVISKEITFHPPPLLIVPPVPANKLEVVRETKTKGRKKYSSIPPKRKKGFKPKIVARSAKGAERSKKIAEGNKQLAKVSQAQRQTEGDKNPLALSIFNKGNQGGNQGGNQADPDFRREAKRQGYTDYNQGQKTYDDEAFGSFGEDWEDDPTHPQYKPNKHDYGQSYNRSGVVSGVKSVNPFASNTQIRIRGREEKQEEGEATSGQKTKLNAGLLAGIERQKLKKKGIEVKDTNESVFTKKGKQEFANKFIEQAKNTDKKMSKEWIKRYVEAQRKDRPNQEYSSKTEAFSKMAEKMFSDYRKEELKSRPLALKGKEDKYQAQRKAFQDKFDEFNKKAQQDLKGSKLAVGKKKKLKEQLEQKRKRLDINLKKLGEKFNK